LDIEVAEQGSFVVAPVVSADEARGRAASFKGSPFGAITQLFSRPKADEVHLEARGLRYEPVWHATCRLRIDYERRETYRFPVQTPAHVAAVTIAGSTFPVEAERKESVIVVPAVAHCLHERKDDLWLDAVSGESISALALGAAAVTPIQLETFAPADATVVAPVVRASAVVRQLLGSEAAPLEADAVHESRAEIDQLDLTFRPIYSFAISFGAKNNPVEIEIDGITGEVSQRKSNVHAAIGKLLNHETLFDLGSETLNLVVPGGAIPLKIVKALSRKRQASP